MKIPLTKITIISESLLKDKLTKLIRENGSTGYTLTKVEGEGSRGTRASDFEGRNVMIETIVSESAADAILEALSDKYFEHFAIIAWLSKVDVLRGEKFVTDTAG